MIWREWYHIRPDSITVWRHPEVRRRLNWYYMVMNGKRLPKFMLARQYMIPGLSHRDLSSLDTRDLLKIHGKVSQEFRSVIIKYSKYADEVKNLPIEGEVSLLDVKTELAKRFASPCMLCERRCKVDRRKKIGACRLDYSTYVHSAFLHLGEEAPLVPSGTIFYGGCNFTCVYCQNHDISQEHPRTGQVVTAKQLARIQDELYRRGSRNINHVGGDPTPSLHTIIESLKHVESPVPQLWNSNMYVSLEALDLLVDLIDIWLPDFKYGSNECALRFSAVPRYWEIITRNLKKSSRHGDMIIRHLVLPGHIECCTRKVLRYIAAELPRDKVMVNIMDQYRPMHIVSRYNRWRELRRRPSRREVEEARGIADELGLCWRPVS